MTLSRADNGDDPAIDAFLGFLATDIKQHPEKIKALAPDLAKRITVLTDGISVNLDDEIDGDVAL
ncbi:type II toxin-antitoxin system PrlF family antitoxin [Parasphingorhabdus sp.]|uniref:type II toxin-antitoxin system PrlF family antitoxin n=1 Tax=Parasphingorhabdus sp. TaxID=2709688 RepID=UPI002F95D335